MLTISCIKLGVYLRLPLTRMKQNVLFLSRNFTVLISEALALDAGHRGEFSQGMHVRVHSWGRPSSDRANSEQVNNPTHIPLGDVGVRWYVFRTLAGGSIGARIALGSSAMPSAVMSPRLDSEGGGLCVTNRFQRSWISPNTFTGLRKSLFLRRFLLPVTIEDALLSA